MTTKLKKSDVFGHDFKMTFRGEKLYTTWCGTMLTTTLNVIIMFYGAALFVDLYNEKPVSTFDEKIWFDMEGDKVGFNFRDANFDFGIGFSTLEEPLDPRIGTWEFSYHTRSKKGGNVTKNVETFKSTLCEENPQDWLNPNGWSGD